MQKSIVACVTAQISCKTIIFSALELAKKLDATLYVVTSQTKKEIAVKRAGSLKILNKLSKITEQSIDIIYSDSPQTALASYINRIEPCHVFIGNPDPNAPFYKEFLANVKNSPISVVGENIIYTIPSNNINKISV